jgi:hypothetical protein
LRSRADTDSLMRRSKTSHSPGLVEGVFTCGQTRRRGAGQRQRPRRGIHTKERLRTIPPAKCRCEILNVQEFNPAWVDNLSAIWQGRVRWSRRATAGAIGGSIRFSQRHYSWRLLRGDRWSSRCRDLSDAPHAARIWRVARQTDMDHRSGGT